MLAGTFSFPQQAGVNDVPIGFTTQVQVDQLSPFGYMGHDVVIELTIDKKKAKWPIIRCMAPITACDDMRQLGNSILFTSFAPATVFGQPTSGKILLIFASHQASTGNGPAEARATFPCGSGRFGGASRKPRVPKMSRSIVEIGPGKGALTKYLLQRARHVVAIELDRELASVLPARFPSLEVVQGDALQVDLNLWPGAPVAGNLPITSPRQSFPGGASATAGRVSDPERSRGNALWPGRARRDYGHFSVDTQFFRPR